MGDERRPWIFGTEGGKGARSRKNKQSTSTTSTAVVSPVVDNSTSTTAPAIDPETPVVIPATPPHAREGSVPSSSGGRAKAKPRRNHAPYYLEVTRSPSCVRTPGPGRVLRLSSSPAVDDLSRTASCPPVVTMKSPPAPVRTGKPEKIAVPCSGSDGGGREGDAVRSASRRGSSDGNSSGGGVETSGKGGGFLPPPSIHREKGLEKGDEGIEHSDISISGVGGSRGGVGVTPTTPLSLKQRTPPFWTGGGGDDLGTPGGVDGSSSVRATLTPGICSPPLPRHRGSRIGGIYGETSSGGGNGGGDYGGSEYRGSRRSAHPRRQGRLNHRGRGAGDGSSGIISVSSQAKEFEESGSFFIGLNDSEDYETDESVGEHRKQQGEREQERWQSVKESRDDSSTEGFSGESDVDEWEWMKEEWEGKAGSGGDRRGRDAKSERRRGAGSRHEESLIDFNGRMLALAAANRLRLSTAVSSTPSTTLHASVMETPPHPIPTVSTPVVPRRRQAMMASASSSPLAAASPKDDFKAGNPNGNTYKKSDSDYDAGGDMNASLWFWSTPGRERVVQGKIAATANACTSTGGSDEGVREMPPSISRGSGKHKLTQLPSERTRPQTRPWPELGLNGPGSKCEPVGPKREKVPKKHDRVAAFCFLSSELESATAVANLKCSSPLDLREDRRKSIKQRHRERLEHFRLIQEVREDEATRSSVIMRALLNRKIRQEIDEKVAKERACRIVAMEERAMKRKLEYRRFVFFAWARLTFSKRRARIEAERMLMTRRASRLRQMFMGWKEKARRSRRARELASRCLGQRKRSAFETWKAAVRSAVVHRLRRSRLLGLKAYFLAWKDFTKRKNARLRELVVKGVSDPSCSLIAESVTDVRSCFLRWKAWAKPRAMARRMARDLERARLRRCFFALATHQHNVRPFLETRRLRTLRTAFDCWRSGLGRILRARLLPTPVVNGNVVAPASAAASAADVPDVGAGGGRPISGDTIVGGDDGEGLISLEDGYDAGRVDAGAGESGLEVETVVDDREGGSRGRNVSTEAFMPVAPFFMYPPSRWDFL